MTTISVRHKLQNQRASLLLDGPLASVAHSLEGSDDVHSVHLQPRNLVATGEVLGIRGGSLCRRAHSIFVILTNKDSREVPQFCLLFHMVKLFVFLEKRDRQTILYASNT